MSRLRDKELIQFIFLQSTKADDSAGWADHPDIRTHGLQSLAKIIQCAQPDEIGR